VFFHFFMGMSKSVFSICTFLSKSVFSIYFMGMSKSVFSITNLVWKTRELGGYGVSGRSQQQIRYKFESTQYKKYHPQRGDGLARISPAK
jgi:hypothetical protein